jgi:hypothetical protein
MWEPRPLATLGASTACNRDICTFNNDRQLISADYSMQTLNYSYTLCILCHIRSQQPAVTRQRPVNNREMVFSAQTVPMAAHATMEYLTPSLINNCTAAEERCFLHSLDTLQVFLNSTLNSQPTIGHCIIYLVSGKMLLPFASTVILGFWPITVYFCLTSIDSI